MDDKWTRLEHVGGKYDGSIKAIMGTGVTYFDYDHDMEIIARHQYIRTHIRRGRENVEVMMWKPPEKSR